MPKKQRRAGGRPQFKVTAALRTKVERLVSCGMTVMDISRVIGCNDDTVRKHFAHELANGAAKRRSEVLEMLYASAKAGNVSAQKHLEAMTGRAIAEASFSGERDAPRAARAPQIGKKEAAVAAATTAGDGTAWHDDLQPPPTALRN